MRGPLLLIVSSLLVVEALPASGQAQVIEIGPGSVRAPSVRVQRRVRLRDRIRRRFRNDDANVEQNDAPQRRSPGALQPPPVPPARPQRSWTSPAPVPPGTTPTADRQSLQTSLILAEAELNRQLSASAAGQAYRDQLHVGRLSELLLGNPAAPLTDEEHKQLQQILDAYNQTLIDPSQRWVSRLSGFEKVQAGLTGLLTPPAAAESGSESVSVERTPSPLLQPRIRPGEPQPTQVLPSVREAR